MNMFAEYTRNIGFRLELSENQMKALTAVYSGDLNPDLPMVSYFALQRKGLITWNPNGPVAEEGPKMTAAGKHVAKLIGMAGA